MPWADLGSVIANTAADTTGQNTGNLTSVLDCSTIPASVGQFTIWHMVLENLTLGAQARIVLNSRTYGGFGPATGANREWNGNLPMRPGDVVYFFWTLAKTATPPKLTAYLAYDLSLPANQEYAR